MWSALVLLSALAAAPVDAGVEKPEVFQWEVPGVVEVLTVPGETWSQGIPVQLYVFRSKENPEVILRDFVQAARKQGLYLAPKEKLPRGGPEVSLTALDPRTEISYTVTLQREGESVAVLIAAADLSRRQKVSGNEVDLPLPPGATRVLSTQLESYETVSFELPDGSDPLPFFREVLPRAGFTESESRIFRRGNEELSIRVVPPRTGQKHTGVVIIRRTAAPPTGEQLFKPTE